MTQITEDEARNMEAGEELDRICAEWMGTHQRVSDSSSTSFTGGRGISHKYPHHHKERAPLKDGEFRMVSVYNVWPKHSTEWAAAGLLMEAMGAWVDLTSTPCAGLRGELGIMVEGDTGPHAVARVAAVCVALEISPEDARRGG